VGLRWWVVIVVSVVSYGQLSYGYGVNGMVGSCRWYIGNVNYYYCSYCLFVVIYLTVCHYVIVIVVIVDCVAFSVTTTIRVTLMLD
jgi:hypothetical protein